MCVCVRWLIIPVHLCGLSPETLKLNFLSLFAARSQTAAGVMEADIQVKSLLISFVLLSLAGGV